MGGVNYIMPRRKKADDQVYFSPTATSPEGREMQIIAKAYDLAEKRIVEGTASAQEIVHWLKMGSPKERLEREIMTEQKKLVLAKTGAIESEKKSDEFYKLVLDAMRQYSGSDEDDEHAY